MTTAFEVMRRHYLERDLAAREWKKEGGKVIFQFASFVGGILNNDDLSEGETIVEQLVSKLKTEYPQP